MKKEIKMIGLDMDGTVFNEAKELTQITKDTIAKAIGQGVIVLPATGRVLKGIPKALLEIPGMRYALTCNGATVCDLLTGKIIYSDCISNQKAYEIVRLLQKEKGIVEVYIEDTCYSDSKYFHLIDDFGIPKALLQYIHESRHVIEDLGDFIKKSGKEIQKVHVLFDTHNPENRSHAFETMKVFHDLDVCYATPFNMEINTSTANKGRAIVELGKKLGIQKESIMTIGDGMNDYKMLKEAGFAVAMGNAVEELKEIADYVTLSNEEDGVAYAIEKFVLKA